MHTTGIDSRVKIQDLIDNQLPSYIWDENPKAIDFLKQYYISQEYQGGPVDISDNLDNYLKVDNLIPEVVVGFTTLTSSIDANNTTISVSSTKGFPDTYGLIKIDNEIITYKGKTPTSFTDCVRGFSGITNYSDNTFSQIDTTINESLIFSTSTADTHSSDQKVENLSSLFLKEFYKKLKATFTPGFEELKFDDKIHAGNFIKRAKDFYQSKGTNESIEILFKVLYAEKPKVINLENYLIKPSAANYVRRAIIITEILNNPKDFTKISGQTLFKENDTSTNASISSLELFSSNGKTYLKIGLFIGNDENATIFGNFIPTPITKVIESVSVGSSIITVDSTLGFAENGIFTSEDNNISYTSKSINQFFGCTGVASEISTASDIVSTDTYIAYENGDLTKPVRLAILNIIDDFTQISENVTVAEGDFVTVKNLGSRTPNISNEEKDIFANSWIYNSNPRYEISSNNDFILKAPILRSSLKKGDEIDILNRNSQSIFTTSKVNNIVQSDKKIIPFGGVSIAATTRELDVRRKINKPISTGASLEFDSVTSDVTNVYFEGDEYGYVASNSLPSGLSVSDLAGIGTDFKFNIETSVVKVSAASISGPQTTDGKYYQLRSEDIVPFKTGDRVFYTPETQNLVGVSTGDYFVKVNGQDFSIYTSRFNIGTSSTITFKLPEGTVHNFVLFDQISEKISGQKILRKIPFSKNIQVGTGQETDVETTGILINGVEISNYKSKDKIFFGPLSSIEILNSGDDVDVVNPPVLKVQDPIGSGTTSLLEPVVVGSLKNVFVDSQNFDVEKIVSVNISGGNGKGASINPILQKRTRDMFFNAADFTLGGGVDLLSNRIVFLEDHFLDDGEEIVYSSTDDNLIQINTNTVGVTTNLANNSSYFVNVVNSKTIELFNTLSDQSTGINKIEFSAVASGVQKFRTKKQKNTISRIDILDEGQDYTYRRLVVDSAGISTTFDTINFNNHGFENGDLIEYSYSGSSIGISTSNKYFVLKKDDNSFRLCNAGSSGTERFRFNRKKFVNIDSVGSGYQYFKYPEVKVEIQYTTKGSSSINDIITTPVVKGKLVDAYLYNKGTGYGSNILNHNTSPKVSVQNGKDASIGVFISNGSILSSFISNPGSEFNSVPDLIVEDSSGSGVGAELRAEISDGKISNVIVVNSGFGYSNNTTSVKVVPSGSNIIIRTNVRSLTVNNASNRAKNGELLKEGNNNLQYSIVNYFERLRNSFGEVNNVRSGIIGWSYDGHPIYGPFVESGVRIRSGYVLDTNSVIDRPVGFDAGFFIEDYKFNNSGDLDEHNGRFEINDEFPNGRYVYHATLGNDNKPAFPYFIGNKFNSNVISDSKLTQDFDFSNTSILRNTQPVRTFEDGVSYDFIREFSGIQRMEVDSVKSGSIDSLTIVESGINYKVGDVLNFDTLENGSGLLASVKSIEGEDIDNVTSTSTQYLDNTFEWENETTVKIYSLPYHNFDSSTIVSISGFSTNLTNLNGQFKIKNPNYFDGNTISTISSSGITTEIYVNQIPDNVSVGNSIGIGTETLSVLGIFRNENILRVERGSTGTSHTVGTAVTYFSDFFTINVNPTEKFDSERPRKIFFNPKESIGVGTITGISTDVSFNFGNITVKRDIPSTSIYIEDHGLINNQKVTYTKPAGTANISISTDGQSSIPLTSASELFVINKSPNLIGIKTSINSKQLFFHTNGDDNDKYLFETTNKNLKGNFEINEAVVSISTSTVDTHGLGIGDQISLDVRPNLSVGIGTSTSIKVQIKNEKLVINPIGFNSTGINTITNQFTIIDHGLNTGDKVFYEDVGTQYLKEFYVYEVDRNNICLTQTLIDANNNPPKIVSFASTGSSSQNISLINPQIQTISNNDLVFDLSHPTVSGYNLRFYSDRNNENEFISIGNTTNLIVSRSGSTTTISDISQIDQLYYALEKDGVLINQDETVNNYSNIIKKDSEYKNTFTISGIGTTTFTFFLDKKPEKLSYIKSECDVLEYSTTSKNVKGSVSELKINSRGSEYKFLPEISSITTSEGKNLLVAANSKTIGDINDIKIIDDSFAYPSDPTLSPEARVSPIINLTNSSTLESITIDNGGRGYTEPPNIIFVGTKSRNVNQTGIINPVIFGDSISSLNVLDPPRGLPDESVEVFTTNNSNGISILEVESLSTTSFKVTITTPGNGGPNAFDEDPFAVNDKVFIEGIVKNGNTGDGFNSSDYGYRFFNVISYDKSGINHKITIDLSNLTTNTGVAVTDQQSLATIINKNDYPQFSITTEFSEFIKGEQLSVNGQIEDLFVQNVDENKLKVTGSYELKVTDIIKGFSSGDLGTVKSLIENKVNFITNFSNVKRIGWENQVGKLSEDFQIIQDSNYYQNLSYSIKSSIPYQTQKSPVENLVHISGLKNFADVEVQSKSGKIATSSDNATVIVKDIIDEKRVDAFIFDLARDSDVVDGKSKFIELNSKKLANHVNLISNEVFKIDDISTQFSNKNSIESPLGKISVISGSDTYENYLIRLNDLQNKQIQLNEITILNSNNNSAIIENEFITNINPSDEYNTSYGNYELISNNGANTLIFKPSKENDKDFDFKILKQTFNTNLIGIGTSSIGCIDLIGSTDKKVSGIGSTNIISVNKNKFKSLFLTAQVIDDLTNEVNFVRIYATHNGTNSFNSQYLSNTSSGLIKSGIGSFDSNLNGSSFEINFINGSSESSTIRSSVVGIATTANGSGTYRFLTNDQSPGDEKSLIYQSGFTSTTSGLSTSVLSFNKSNFNASRSIVEVTTGSIKSLHQVMMIIDDNDVFVQQSPFLSASVDQYSDDAFKYFDNVTGIGTFGGTQTVSECILNFYPNSDQNSSIELISFSKLFYIENDLNNDPNTLTFGSVNEDLYLSEYKSKFGERINQKSFELKNNNIPIFVKKFNPSDTSIVSNEGIFTLPNHFFKKGEKLIYTPKSSIPSVSATPMKMNATDDLPSTVFAIYINDNQFKVATTQSNAIAGIGTTISSRGTGNIHQFSATKQNSKCIITVDGLVQFPISSTKLTYTLNNSIGVSTTFASLSGISTINSGDVLKIDDEFVKIKTVGIGTSISGPISGTGSFNLIEFDRGVLGSLPAVHSSSTSSAIFKGSFNIVDSTIHFLEAPKGDPNLIITGNNSNKIPDTSDFSGRVFTRSSYTDNKVYDDISDEFTGIGRTFTIRHEGSNTVGIGTSGGSTILFVNNIFQTPNTSNNTDNNYDILEDNVAGISTVVFTGIKNEDSFDIITSETDVNLNEVPRGGVIVSLGSTPGLGFAPLVGASVTAVVGAGGSIVSVGLGATDNLGSGYNGLVSIGITVLDSTQDAGGDPASITAVVGAGGTLSFNVGAGGTGYNNPKIFVSDPSYENLPVIGVSRIGVGATTDTGKGLLLSLELGGGTGIGSTMFEVKNFKISRPGFGFRKGDVIKPIGLTTDKNLTSPVNDFELTVLETYTDNFSAWQFGDLDFIDSIKDLQNGVRTNFPLKYQGTLLSFESDEPTIRDNFSNLLIIFINGVLQEPETSYTFDGGTSFRFETAPSNEDRVAIYFYKGTSGVDSTLVTDILPILEQGDDVKLLGDNKTIQNERSVYDLSFARKFETNLYTDQGINDIDYRSLLLIKQKRDKKINGVIIDKSRNTLTSQIYPTAKIIKDVSTTDNEIFVDDADLFKYGLDTIKFNGLLVDGISGVGTAFENISNFTQVSGFSGIITGISTSTGIGVPLALEFEIHDASSPSFVGLDTGNPIYIFDTVVGNGVTSIDNSDSAVVGVGTTFVDNIYYISDYSTSGNLGIITCNVKSDSSIVGLGTTGSISNPVGKYSWGKLSGTLSRSNPVSIGVSGRNASGLSTFPTIQRRDVGHRKTGSLFPT